MFQLDAHACAWLAKQALDGAGIKPGEVGGIPHTAVPEASMFAPEYLGKPVNFAGIVDPGGSSGAGMIWRAAAAVGAGVCETGVCVTATIPLPPDAEARYDPERAYFGAAAWGAPHGQFDIPYGLVTRTRTSRWSLSRNLRHPAQAGTSSVTSVIVGGIGAPGTASP